MVGLAANCEPVDDPPEVSEATETNDSDASLEVSTSDTTTSDASSESDVETFDDAGVSLGDALDGGPDALFIDADASVDTSTGQQVVVQPVASDQTCHCWPHGGNCGLLNLPPEDVNPEMICPDREICTGDINAWLPDGVFGKCVRPCTPGGVESNPDSPTVLVCPDGYFCKGPTGVYGAEWEETGEYYSCAPTSAFTGQDDEDTSQ